MIKIKNQIGQVLSKTFRKRSRETVFKIITDLEPFGLQGKNENIRNKNLFTEHIKAVSR